MNNSFEKQKANLAAKIMKAKTPADFKRIINTITELPTQNHELCSIQKQATKGRFRVSNLSRNEQIQYHKQRQKNYAEKAKAAKNAEKAREAKNAEKAKEAINAEKEKEVINALLERFKKLCTKPENEFNARLRSLTNRQNYSKHANRHLALQRYANLPIIFT